MAKEYRFQSKAYWVGGRRGIAELESPSLSISFGVPPEFQGESGVWTPEHFFLSAITSCFLTTFAAIAELSHFSFGGLNITTEGVIEKAADGLQFTRVILRPELRIAHDDDHERALRLIEKAERSCLIARSLKCPVSVEATIQSGVAETAA